MCELISIIIFITIYYFVIIIPQFVMLTHIDCGDIFIPPGYQQWCSRKKITKTFNIDCLANNVQDWVCYIWTYINIIIKWPLTEFIVKLPTGNLPQSAGDQAEHVYYDLQAWSWPPVIAVIHIQLYHISSMQLSLFHFTRLFVIFLLDTEWYKQHSPNCRESFRLWGQRSSCYITGRVHTFLWPWACRTLLKYSDSLKS